MAAIAEGPCSGEKRNRMVKLGMTGWTVELQSSGIPYLEKREKKVGTGEATGWRKLANNKAK